MYRSPYFNNPVEYSNNGQQSLSTPHSRVEIPVFITHEDRENYNLRANPASANPIDHPSANASAFVNAPYDPLTKQEGDAAVLRDRSAHAEYGPTVKSLPEHHMDHQFPWWRNENNFDNNRYERATHIPIQRDKSFSANNLSDEGLSSPYEQPYRASQLDPNMYNPYQHFRNSYLNPRQPLFQPDSINEPRGQQFPPQIFQTSMPDDFWSWHHTTRPPSMFDDNAIYQFPQFPNTFSGEAADTFHPIDKSQTPGNKNNIGSVRQQQQQPFTLANQSFPSAFGNIHLNDPPDKSNNGKNDFFDRRSNLNPSNKWDFPTSEHDDKWDKPSRHFKRRDSSEPPPNKVRTDMDQINSRLTFVESELERLLNELKLNDNKCSNGSVIEPGSSQKHMEKDPHTKQAIERIRLFAEYIKPELIKYVESTIIPEDRERAKVQKRAEDLLKRIVEQEYCESQIPLPYEHLEKLPGHVTHDASNVLNGRREEEKAQQNEGNTGKPHVKELSSAPLENDGKHKLALLTDYIDNVLEPRCALFSSSLGVKEKSEEEPACKVDLQYKAIQDDITKALCQCDAISGSEISDETRKARKYTVKKLERMALAVEQAYCLEQS